MSLERALAPIALVVGALALGTWLLLVNEVWLGPWLLAFLVLAHGWVHVLFLLPKPPSPNAVEGVSSYPFDFERSWLRSRVGLDGGFVHTVGSILVLATFALAALAALAIVDVLVPHGLWAVLMMGTAGSSAITLALFFSPALILGFVIDALMVTYVIVSRWSQVV